MCFCPINDSIWGSPISVTKQLHRSLITSGKLTLPLWKPLIYWCRSFDISYTSFAFMSCVFCFRNKVSLYIPLLSESKRDLAKWFQWHSAAFRANDLNCMYSQEMTPWYWYCILICIASFSQSFYNCTEWVFQSDSTRIFHHYMYCFSLTAASSSINMHKLFHDSY